MVAAYFGGRKTTWASVSAWRSPSCASTTSPCSIWNQARPCAGTARRASPPGASVKRSSRMRVPGTRASVSRCWRAAPRSAGSAAISLSLKIVAMEPPWNLTQARSSFRGPRIIATNRQAPRIYLRMIPLCSRFDSMLLTPKMSAIASYGNYSRSPLVIIAHNLNVAARRLITTNPHPLQGTQEPKPAPRVFRPDFPRAFAPKRRLCHVDRTICHHHHHHHHHHHRDRHGLEHGGDCRGFHHWRKVPPVVALSLRFVQAKTWSAPGPPIFLPAGRYAARELCN